MTTRIGDLTRTSRLRMNLTQEQLAKRVGISRSYLAQVELGRRRPTEQVTRALARSLGLSLYEAFEAADLLTEAETDAADMMAGHAMDKGASEAEIARVRDEVLIDGGTLTRTMNGRKIVIHISPRAAGPLIGWDELSYEHQHLVQELVNGLLNGYPKAG